MGRYQIRMNASIGGEVVDFAHPNRCSCNLTITESANVGSQLGGQEGRCQSMSHSATTEKIEVPSAHSLLLGLLAGHKVEIQLHDAILGMIWYGWKIATSRSPSFTHWRRELPVVSV